MYRKQARRRRAILFALVAVSLTLLSVYFGEGQGGPLHRIQRVVATGLGPVEGVANRALKPGRDLVNWFSETFEARGDNKTLRRELADLRDQLARSQNAARQVKELGSLAKLTGGGTLPAGYTAVTARIVGRSPTVWYSTVTIDKGTGDGLRVDDPVVAPGGLAGRIEAVTRTSAEVSLITDANSSVTGRVLPDGAIGLVEPTVGDPGKLALNFVKRNNKIKDGQIVVTAGFASPGLASLFPSGIPVGKVTDTSLEQQQAYQRVTIRPFADLRDAEFVQVLTQPTG